MTSAAPTARPVHPCVTTLTPFGTRGVEHAVWAYWTHSKQNNSVPNLITACASTINIYRLHLDRLVWCESHTVAGAVIHLAVLPCPDPASSDSLLIAVGGSTQQWSICSRANKNTSRLSSTLQAQILLDFTSIINEQSYGAVSPLEHDAIVSTTVLRPGQVLAAAIFGGGVAVVVVQFSYSRQTRSWRAPIGPFVLPLHVLGQELATSAAVQSTHPVSTGWGGMLSLQFLSGYREPVLVILHGADPSGPAFVGHWTPTTSFGLLSVTAVSIEMSAHRSAHLWSTAVGADGLELQAPTGIASNVVYVMGANSITTVAHGRVKSVVATNGWAPQAPVVKSNPRLPLSIALDGCAWEWLSATCAMVVLRRGAIYMWHRVPKRQEFKDEGDDDGDENWALWPIGQTLGKIGNISYLAALQMGSSAAVAERLLGKEPASTENGSNDVEYGLVLAGSRLGDSVLLAYALEFCNAKTKQDRSLSLVKTEVVSDDLLKELVPSVSKDVEQILYEEEMALYESSDKDTMVKNETLSDKETSMVVSNSDEEDAGKTTKSRKRPRTNMYTSLNTLTPIDVLTNFGPLGPVAEGPIAALPECLKPSTTALVSTAIQTHSVEATTALIYPCGYGTSGGLALVTVPGRDDRLLLSETDCVNIAAMFNMSNLGLVLLGIKSGGMKILQANADSAGKEVSVTIEEVDISKRFSQDQNEDLPLQSIDDLLSCKLLESSEVSDSSFVMLAEKNSGDQSMYHLVIVASIESRLHLTNQFEVSKPHDDDTAIITSTSCFQLLEDTADTTSIALLWSNGSACYISFTPTSLLGCIWIHGNNNGRMDIEDEDDNHMADKDILEYYRSDRIVAVDLTMLPEDMLKGEVEVPLAVASGYTAENGDASSKAANVIEPLDEEDAELYRDAVEQNEAIDVQYDVTSKVVMSDKQATYMMVSRQSGKLEVYSASNIDEHSPSPCWISNGVGFGERILIDDSSPSYPKSQKVCVQEMCTFTCGPTNGEMMQTRNIYLAVALSNGDFVLYVVCNDTESTPHTTFMQRADLDLISRQSQEQTKHHTKLVRKRMIAKEDDTNKPSFSYRRFSRYNNISGQSGLFAALSCPFWVVSERGMPFILHHRTRHAAPAGTSSYPITAFCSGIKVGQGTCGDAFFVLHDRVGRVGSQRLTLYLGLTNAIDVKNRLGEANKSDIVQPILPGGGLCAERITLGVTVRQIQLISDPELPSDRSLYAVLISKDLEVDQSDTNDDGLTEEERQQIKNQKEAEKMKKQVEADLGGFDIDNEWVEEIEREDAFPIDTKLGGAPHMMRQSYSLWIVDATSQWSVVDSYDLDEHEYGMTMQVMPLSCFTQEPGSNMEEVDEFDPDCQVFVTIGTGIVGNDGEDVTSKGRTLLFRVMSRDSGSIDLSLEYVREIFHGPVSSLTCISNEGRHRLLIGAGADLNVEQWGNNKLTQVGFYRATMQVVNIKFFKHFLLLSDAYDSIYFLIWRESDKSLTLLAKDYDPIPVFSAGVMNRGSSVTFICHDNRQNLQFFQYSPGEASARGGNKLVCRADYRIGTQSIDLNASFPCRSSLLAHSATLSSTLAALKQQDIYYGRLDDDQRSGCYFGTTDSTIITTVPLSEPVYWRLAALQSILNNALESPGGLSNRAWRLYRRSPYRFGCRNNDRKKGVVDGDLVRQFANLSVTDQEDLASAIGSSVSLIIDNILEIQCSSSVL